MSTVTKHIALDFYTTNIVSVYAKQADANSRFINVTCTDHGKKVKLDNNTVSAFIRQKKSDGTIIYNDVIIDNDGIIQIKLTSQMLAVSGKQIADVMILSMPGISSDKLNSLNNIDDLSNVSVISVMPFQLIVSESPIDNSDITSSDEFDALVQATVRMRALESQVRAKEQERDASRDATEAATAEADAAASKANTAADKADAAASKANTAADKADDKADKADDKANKADSAADRAEAAASDAEAAVEEFKAIKDQSGIIMQDEKGQANGIATLNENGKVPSSQLNIANNLTTTTTGMLLDASQGNQLRSSIEGLQNIINNLQKIHFNNTVDHSIGNDGDILMVPMS